ncbi:hypothetical protein KK106_08260 [Curtobacterium flaccumfaciens pv. flaccumfaciens]|nr:hypothetical protein [Curtobacterium flaccumfaciens pv. flaccumfaciens]
MDSTASRAWPTAADVRLVTRWEKLLAKIRSSTVMHLHVVEGQVTGPALDLFMAADVRIASPSAEIFLPMNDGNVWPGIGIHHLAREVGGHAASRAVLWQASLSLSSGDLSSLVDFVSESPWEMAAQVSANLSVLDAAELQLRRNLLADAQQMTFSQAVGVHLASCERELRRMRASEEVPAK